MYQSDSLAREQDCGQRGPHAVELGFVLDLVCDGRVAFAGGCFELAQQILTGLVVVEMSQCGDHQLRGHFTGGVTAHAVGQRQ